MSEIGNSSLHQPDTESLVERSTGNNETAIISDNASVSSSDEETDDENDQPPLFKLSKINLPHNKRLKQLIHPQDNICLISDRIINDSIIIAGTELGYIYIINIQTLDVMKRLKLHRDYIMCIDINDKGWFMSCCIEGNVSIINYNSFLDYNGEKEVEIDSLDIKRVNFNRSLNFVKIHPNFNNKNNKCFFISSFNGSLLAVNLNTFKAREIESEKGVEKGADFTNNWLSYIPTFSSNSKKENNDGLHNKLSFDVKITNLLDLDSITYLEIINNDKLLIIDFNELYIMDLNSPSHEILLQLNIEPYHAVSGDESSISSVIYKKNYFLNLNKYLLLIDIVNFKLLKEITLVEKENKRIVSMKLFNHLPLEWEKIVTKDYDENLPPLLIITNCKETTNLNLQIIEITPKFDLIIHETIEIPVAKTELPLKVTSSNYLGNPKVIVLFDSVIIKINPFQRDDIYKWFVDNGQLFNAWKVCKSSQEKLHIGIDLIKGDIEYLDQVLNIQNYDNSTVTKEDLSYQYNEFVVENYCHNKTNGYKVLVEKLFSLGIESNTDSFLLNSIFLTKIFNKIIEVKDFRLLIDVFEKWETHLMFSQVDYNQIIDQLLRVDESDQKNVDFLNCLYTSYYRTNQFGDCVKIIYKLIKICDDDREADSYKHKLFQLIQVSPKLLINIAFEDGQFNNFLTIISNTLLQNIKDFKTHFKLIIKVMISNISIDNIILLASKVDEEKFSEFKFLLLSAVYALAPPKNIKAITLSIIQLYLDNDLLMEYNPSLIQFLLINSNNYDPKEVLGLILQKNKGTLSHNEELIYLYSQLNDYNSALKLILETGLTNPINYIMTTEVTINDQNLWKDILNYSKENDNLLTKEIIRTINKNEKINMNTIIFLYAELLNDINCCESTYQNGMAITGNNLNLKKLEYSKLKSLLTTELKCVFAQRMKYLQMGKYHE